MIFLKARSQFREFVPALKSARDDGVEKGWDPVASFDVQRRCFLWLAFGREMHEDESGMDLSALVGRWSVSCREGIHEVLLGAFLT
jgi:hypothetical protein